MDEQESFAKLRFANPEEMEQRKLVIKMRLFELLSEKFSTRELDKCGLELSELLEEMVNFFIAGFQSQKDYQEKRYQFLLKFKNKIGESVMAMDISLVLARFRGVLDNYWLEQRKREVKKGN